MKRLRRIAPVQQVFDATREDCMRELGAARQEAEAAQHKLAELRQYRADYSGSFQQRARGGCGAAALRDFQAFLAKLDLALRQQEQAVIQARERAEQCRLRWQTAARRSRALDTVVERWREDERTRENQREQRQADERAQQCGRGALQESKPCP